MNRGTQDLTICQIEIMIWQSIQRKIQRENITTRKNQIPIIIS